MTVVIIVALIVAGISLYDYFSARNWQQVTSSDRNEIVFADRNKEYGAYVLRRDYDKRMVIILVSFVATIGITFATFSYIKSLPAEEEFVPPAIDVTTIPPAPPEEDLPPPPPEPPVPVTEKLTAFLPPVVVDIEVDNPPTIQENLENANISTKNQDGDEGFGTPTGPVDEGPKQEERKEEEILEFVEEDAGFPGGPGAMQQWIAKNVQYPQSAIELGEQGKVYVSFVVEPSGDITNVQVERGISDDLDREAKRVVRGMPNWKPGKNGGKAVRTRCRLPINFSLQ